MRVLAVGLQAQAAHAARVHLLLLGGRGLRLAAAALRFCKLFSLFIKIFMMF